MGTKHSSSSTRIQILQRRHLSQAAVRCPSSHLPGRRQKCHHRPFPARCPLPGRHRKYLLQPFFARRSLPTVCQRRDGETFWSHPFLGRALACSRRITTSWTVTGPRSSSARRGQGRRQGLRLYPCWYSATQLWPQRGARPSSLVRGLCPVNNCTPARWLTSHGMSAVGRRSERWSGSNSSSGMSSLCR